MKRGFLLPPAERKKKAVERKRGVQATEPKTVPQKTLKKAIRREDLPSQFRLPYGDLSEQERALPESYDKNQSTYSVIEQDPTITRFNLKPEQFLLTTIDDGDGSTEWLIKDSKTKAKVFERPGFPSSMPKPHREGLYEVRQTDDMGQGIFAKHDIKRGEIVFSERPLLVAPCWVEGVPSLAQYTVDQYRQVMMCECEKILAAAINRMSEDTRARYMALCNSHLSDGSGPLLGILRTNAFGLEELCDEGDITVYGAVCELGSRINHHCSPNLIYKFRISSFSFHAVASKDIKAGEQLFYSYCSHQRSKAERQTDLAPYGISCNCKSCVDATPATDKLRKTFTDHISRLSGLVKQGPPEWTNDALSSALRLEADMVAEGLDVLIDFVTLLMTIFLAFSNLGRRAEAKKYGERWKEYYKTHNYDGAFPSPELCSHK